VFLLALLGLAFLFIPWLLRLVLGLTPLPDGPLRRRLLATAERLGFRFTDILVWHTRGTVAHAMVTRLVPFLRYVVLPDRLIDELSEQEVEAVFGHEVGHVKHHHMLFYLGFLLTSLMVLGGVWVGLESAELVPALDDEAPALYAWLAHYQILTVL